MASLMVLVFAARIIPVSSLVTTVARPLDHQEDMSSTGV